MDFKEIVKACYLILASSNRLFQAANIAMIKPQTVMSHQKRYINVAVNNHWSRENEELIQRIKITKQPLNIAGDARCDSMGHR